MFYSNFIADAVVEPNDNMQNIEEANAQEQPAENSGNFTRFINWYIMNVVEV